MHKTIKPPAAPADSTLSIVETESSFAEPENPFAEPEDSLASFAEQADASPVEPEIVTEETKVVPVEPEVAPTDPGSIPVETEAASADPEVEPKETEKAPVEPEIVTEETKVVPLEPEASPTEPGKEEEEVEKEAETIIVGSRVKLGDGRTGIVHFIGLVHFRPGAMTAGIQLDDPYVGTSDGSVDGWRYFDAPDQKVEFEAPENLVLNGFPMNHNKNKRNSQVYTPISLTQGNDVEPSKVADVPQMESADVKDSEAIKSTDQGASAEPGKEDDVVVEGELDKIIVGSRVKLDDGRTGMVHFIGLVHFRPDAMTAGVVLDNPYIGSSDGSVDGWRYFDTQDQKAEFKPLEDLVLNGFPTNHNKNKRNSQVYTPIGIIQESIVEIIREGKEETKEEEEEEETGGAALEGEENAEEVMYTTIYGKGTSSFQNGDILEISLDYGTVFKYHPEKVADTCEKSEIAADVGGANLDGEGMPATALSITIDSAVAPGNRVRLSDGRTGVVRFVGPVHFGNGEVHAGIELDVPHHGYSDGAVGGWRYFDAAPQTAVFTKTISLVMDEVEGEVAGGAHMGEDDQEEYDTKLLETKDLTFDLDTSEIIDLLE